jgi:hypothetical protein
VGKALSEIRRWSQDVKYEMNQAFNAEVVVTRDPTPLADPAPTALTEPVAEAHTENASDPAAPESPAPASEAPADEPKQ